MRNLESAADKYVLYWMQQAQRLRYNAAFNYAASKAAERNQQLLVCFVVTTFPEAEDFHYSFMLQNLVKIEEELRQRGTGFVIRSGEAAEEVVKLCSDASILVMDRGFLRLQREWRQSVQKRISCPFRIIDTDTIIPPAVVSAKSEIAARTLRPKIRKLLPQYLQPIPEPSPMKSSLNLSLLNSNERMWQNIKEKFSLQNKYLQPGEDQAQKKLRSFIENKLPEYHLHSNDPSLEISSELSAYLHFGQISSRDIALQIMQSRASQEAKDAFLEQLIVRRELAVNFIWYNLRYDEYEYAVPEWAKKTLNVHTSDRRKYLYSREQLENASTHDEYWNAAQNQLLKSRFMHNYMRMYWGKKIIEWTASPQDAYDTMKYLNNKYQLDGRDACSFTGIAWCFGLHDHPWQEREIFGKIRYMNAAGLERKFKIRNYARKWNRRV